MTDGEIIARLQGQNDTLRMQVKMEQAKWSSEYHRAEKLKAQMLNMGRAIDVLRRHATDSAKAEAEKVFKQ